MTKIEFVFRMASALREAMDAGARLNPAVAVAQAALESQWGNTVLAREGNNLFSIKAGEDWLGETLVLTGEEWEAPRGWVRESTIWRKYVDWAECVRDYAAILTSVPWYHEALQHTGDPRLFLQAILPAYGRPGWATDPDYFRKVEEIGREIEALGGPTWDPAKI